MQPIGVLEDMRVIWGHGRYLAVKQLGWSEIETRIYPATLSVTEIAILRFAENEFRTATTPFQRFRLCEGLLAENPDMLAKDMAALLHVTPGMMTRLLSPAKAGGPWIELLEAGLVSLEECYHAARLSEKERFELLATKCNGTDNGPARRLASGRTARRRATNPNGAKSRITIPVAGAAVNICGQMPDMPALMRALESALEEVRIAGTGCEFKAFARMMRQARRKVGNHEQRIQEERIEAP